MDAGGDAEEDPVVCGVGIEGPADGPGGEEEFTVTIYENFFRERGGRGPGWW